MSATGVFVYRPVSVGSSNADDIARLKTDSLERRIISIWVGNLAVMSAEQQGARYRTYASVAEADASTDKIALVSIAGGARTLWFRDSDDGKIKQLGQINLAPESKVQEIFRWIGEWMGATKAQLDEANDLGMADLIALIRSLESSVASEANQILNMTARLATLEAKVESGTASAADKAELAALRKDVDALKASAVNDALPLENKARIDTLEALISESDTLKIDFDLPASWASASVSQGQAYTSDSVFSWRSLPVTIGSGNLFHYAMVTLTGRVNRIIVRGKIGATVPAFSLPCEVRQNGANIATVSNIIPTDAVAGMEFEREIFLSPARDNPIIRFVRPAAQLGKAGTVSILSIGAFYVDTQDGADSVVSGITYTEAIHSQIAAQGFTGIQQSVSSGWAGSDLVAKVFTTVMQGSAGYSLPSEAGKRYKLRFALPSALNNRVNLGDNIVFTGPTWPETYQDARVYRETDAIVFERDVVANDAAYEGTIGITSATQIQGPSLHVVSLTATDQAGRVHEVARIQDLPSAVNLGPLMTMVAALGGRVGALEARPNPDITIDRVTTEAYSGVVNTSGTGETVQSLNVACKAGDDITVTIDWSDAAPTAFVRLYRGLEQIALGDVTAPIVGIRRVFTHTFKAAVDDQPIRINYNAPHSYFRKVEVTSGTGDIKAFGQALARKSDVPAPVADKRPDTRWIATNRRDAADLITRNTQTGSQARQVSFEVQHPDDATKYITVNYVDCQTWPDSGFWGFPTKFHTLPGSNTVAIICAALDGRVLIGAGRGIGVNVTGLQVRNIMIDGKYVDLV